MLLLWITLLSPILRAHPPGLSSAQIEEGRLTLTFSAAELDAMGFADDDPRLPEALFAPADLRTEAGRCAAGPVAIGRTEQDGVTLSAAVDCPAGARFVYSAPFLVGMEAGHRHQVFAFGEPVGQLDPGSIALDFGAAPGAASVAGTFLVLGVEHIVTGYDHLAFLLALVLVARGGREMLLIVSGFTLAHSITLSAAALGLVSPPALVVEAAIAASIVYAGLENLWRPSLRRRVAVTFALGLLHGFGFAGLLAELGLPERHLLVALLAFNGGVELGQAALVAVVLPLLLWMGRFAGWVRVGVPALSLGVAAMGVFWLVERLGGA